MNSHNTILQLDGNTSECVNEVREQNEYEKRDPNNREEAPYFLSDEDLEDFVIQCKVCDIEKDGKKSTIHMLADFILVRNVQHLVVTFIFVPTEIL